MDSPLPSGHCKGLVAVGHFFGRDLACGVSGMPLPGYVTMFHTSWKVHVPTAFDRTRATHYGGDAEHMG